MTDYWQLYKDTISQTCDGKEGRMRIYKGRQELADFLRMHIDTFDNLVKEFGIELKKIGRQVSYTKDEAIELHDRLRKLQKNKKGYIYFIQAEDKAVKIGFTYNKPNIRLNIIQSNCPLKLKLLHFIEGTENEEKKLHKRFKKHRKIREWFYPHKVIFNYIDKLQKGGF